ncbi:hypothetical protein [Chondromyces crocatus]|nr:hypothetical protein [Chondromyces crocatus]
MSVATGALLMGGWGSVAAGQDGSKAVQEVPAAAVAEACGQEMVSWAYDAERQVLALSDGSVQLNCCGQRSMQVERVDNVIEITERDRPDEGGRCASSCTFDLGTSVTQVAPGSVFVKLLRDVTDENGSPVLVWQGSLDLAQGTGQVAMEDAAPGPCQVAAR